MLGGYRLRGNDRSENPIRVAHYGGYRLRGNDLGCFSIVRTT